MVWQMYFKASARLDFSVTVCVQFNNPGFFVPKFTLGSGRNLQLAFRRRGEGKRIKQELFGN